MTLQMIFVMAVVAVAIYALINNNMRQGLVLFSAAALLYIGGVLSAEELLSGFSNRGVMTIALLFLVSEAVKRTGAISNLIRPLFTKSDRGVLRRLLPSVALISTMINNTPVVIIIAPIVKSWADRLRIPASKYLIPLSYATILGGMCSLVGSSTNLVVHGMMLEAGYGGFSMYELGRVGIFIAVVGIGYLVLFSKYLLPDGEVDSAVAVDDRACETSTQGRKKWMTIALLLFMCGGTLLGEHPEVQSLVPNVRLDMFFFALITTIIMAWAELFSARRYTKYISWDLLVTIASAFAISQAMQNSGIVDLLITKIVALMGVEGVNPYILLALLFIITNIFTEMLTNNAAAALSFPIAISIATQFGLNPMPFFVTICIAASSSFSTPIGYQTNLVVQGLGGYRYVDFLRIGLPLNIITFVLSITLIPLIWRF